MIIYEAIFSAICTVEAHHIEEFVKKNLFVLTKRHKTLYNN